MNNRHVRVASSLPIGVSGPSIPQFFISRERKETFPMNETSAPLSPVIRDDLELYTGLIQGDESSFIALVERYHSALWGFAQIFGFENDLVEKIVMNTWESVLHKCRLFEREYSFKIWLFEILIEKIQFHITQASAVVIPREGNTTIQLGGPGQSEGRLPDVKKSPKYNNSNFSREKRRNATYFERKGEPVLMQELKLALFQLPLKHKQVMYLRDVEQFTSQDVMHLLQVSESQQRTLLQTAREAIQSSLDGARL